jgi:hypothetical protein
LERDPHARRARALPARVDNTSPSGWTRPAIAVCSFVDLNAPMTMSSRAIYYAFDLSPRCVQQFLHSVASVRLHCKDIPIYAVVWGSPSSSDHALFDAHQVTVLSAKSQSEERPTFLKWRALEQCCRESDILFLDTDTIVLGDVNRVFDERGPEDFHARLEVACDPNPLAYPCLVNTSLIMTTQISHGLLAKINAAVEGATLPVFNTGVMLFRNGLAARLADRWTEIIDLARLFRRKQMPYPSRNTRLMDEVAASIVLGRVESLRWSMLDPTTFPFFLEYARHRSADALIMHTWAMYYAHYLFEHHGRKAGLEYLRLPAHRSRSRGFNQWMALGLKSFRLSEPWVDRWVKYGGSQFHRLTLDRHDERVSARHPARASVTGAIAHRDPDRTGRAT